MIAIEELEVVGVNGSRWYHTTPATDPQKASRFERWGRIGTSIQYAIILRGTSYEAQKNGKIIGQFPDLEAAQRCVEASLERSRKYRRARGPHVERDD
jgi:hypothetical protein